MLTESDEIARVLELAANRWPELEGDKNKLLKRLLEVGGQTLQLEMDQQALSRSQQLSKIAGSLTGVWPSNWLKERKAEWPA